MEKRNNRKRRESFKLNLHTPKSYSLLDLSLSISVVCGNKRDIFITEALIFIIFTEIHMANPDENHTGNTPNDLSSTHKGQQFSFSSPTASSNQPPALFNPSPSSAGNVLRTTLSDEKL